MNKSLFDGFHQAVNYLIKAADSFCSVAYQALPGGRYEVNPLSSAAVRLLSSHLSLVCVDINYRLLKCELQVVQSTSRL